MHLIHECYYSKVQNSRKQNFLSDKLSIFFLDLPLEEIQIQDQANSIRDLDAWSSIVFMNENEF